MNKDYTLFLKCLAKPTYIRSLKNKYNIKIKNIEVANKADGGTLILFNHAHALDPLFFVSVFPHYVRWVSGSYLFKKPFTRFVMKGLLDCISKSQGRSDLSTITEIRKTLQNGVNVGLFPEGTRTWDGDFIPISAATAKLVKLLRANVLIINLESAFALHPRWASYKRKGPLVINAKKFLTGDEIKALSLDEIETILNENLAFSNDKWQEENHVAYPHKKGAEGIERLFYTCSKCNSVSSIHAEGNTVCCSSCNTKDELDPYLRLKGNFGFTKLKEWNDFQRNKILSINEFSPDKGDFFRKDVNNKFQMISTNYTSVLKNDGIVIKLSDNTIYDFKFNDIKSLILSVQQTIEIVYNSVLYSFKLDTDANALKYLHMFEEHSKGKNV